MDYLLRSQEWGPMNRTVLRAESLAWAVRALPDHPQANLGDAAPGPGGRQLGQLGDRGRHHLPCGLALRPAAAMPTPWDRLDELFQTPEMYYYAHYFLNLMCPAGMIPDFGDANWQSNWQRYLVFFETAATQYQDPASQMGRCHHRP